MASRVVRGTDARVVHGAREVREVREVRVLGKSGLRGVRLDARDDIRRGLAVGLVHCLAVADHYCGACVYRGDVCCGLRVAGHRDFVLRGFDPRDFGNCVVVHRVVGAHRHRVLRGGARFGLEGLAGLRWRRKIRGRRVGRLREPGRSVWARNASQLELGSDWIRRERVRGGWVPGRRGLHPAVFWHGSPVSWGLRRRWSESVRARWPQAWGRIFSLRPF